MEQVNHKLFGTGDVVKREVVSEHVCITVRFGNEKEMRFVIPESFETGALKAEGCLKEEVDKALEKKKINLTVKQCSTNKSTTSPSATRRYGKKQPKKVVPRGSLADAFEEYLIKAGYRVETDSGNPSTVFVYIRAVEAVLTEEGKSWNTLKNDIPNIVRKYDVGGAKAHFGCRSNNTVINALKRFEDFVNAA